MTTTLNHFNKDIFLIGGTTVDVRIGQKILLSEGFVTKTIYVSDNPINQSNLQTNDLEKLKKRVIELILKNKAKFLLVFCNSLSFALDWQEIAYKTDCIIHDLKYSYTSLLNGVKSEIVM